MKKNAAIIFILNRKMLPALASMLINLQETNNSLYDNVIIYHDDFSEEDCNKLIKIERRVVFIKSDYSSFIDKHGEIKGERGKNFMARYTHLPLIRYRIFEQLEYYHKILYLDCDMLIRGSLEELFQIKGVAWRNAVLNFRSKFESSFPIDRFIEFYETDPKKTEKWPTPNGGLIYAADLTNYKECVDIGRDFIKEFADYYHNNIDEMIFGYIVARLNIPLTSLDREIYNTMPLWYKKETKIVHFMMRDKIWDNALMQLVFPEWINNYEQSKKISSFEDDIFAEQDKYYLRKKIYEENWIDVLNNKIIVVPQELKLPFDFCKNTIRLYYSENIYYVLSLDVMLRNIGISLVIDKIENEDNEYITKLLQNAIKNDNLYEMKKSNETSIEIKVKKRYSYESINDAFTDFYKKTICFIIVMLSSICKPTEPCKKISDYINRDVDLLSSVRLKDYFEIIEKKHYLSIISGKDECSAHFEEFILNSKLKCITAKPTFRKAFIAIIKGGDLIFQSETNLARVSWNNTIEDNNVKLQIISEGYKKGDMISKIEINGIDFSEAKRGLNIVTLNEQGKVLDSINIDTWKDNQFKINRNNLLFTSNFEIL